MARQRWEWRWWFDGAMCGSAGHWRAVAPAPPDTGWRAPGSLVPALAMLGPPLLLPLTEAPFSGPDLALLCLVASALVGPQFLPMANLDRIRRGRAPLLDWFPPLRPASWYRFVAVVAVVLFLAELAELAAAPIGFRLTRGLIDALALGTTGVLALHALHVWRWAARGALVPPS